MLICFLIKLVNTYRILENNQIENSHPLATWRGI
jgi:hypothetical protein